MTRGPRRLAWLAARLALASLLFASLLEAALRALQPVSASVRSWTAPPPDAHDFDRARTTAELLDRSVLGFHPFVDQGGFVTNSRGFRTEEYAPDKAPGSFRIVALGDSFTFASGGVPWPELWTTRLRERLADVSGQPVELVNLGVPAVGPSFERRVWELEGASLHPDLVLLALFVGNDFTDESPAVDAGFLARCGHVSCAARLLRNALDAAPSDDAAPPPAPGTRGGYAVGGYERTWAEHAPYHTDAQIALIETHQASICDRHRGVQFAQLFGRVTDALRRLHAEVDAAGARLAVVIIPARCQVNAADRAAALSTADRPDSDFDWDLPQQRLAAFLQGEGVPFLDLTPALREAAGVQELYTRGDTHWSPAGNRLVAERVAAWAQAQGWPPASGGR